MFIGLPGMWQVFQVSYKSIYFILFNSLIQSLPVFAGHITTETRARAVNMSPIPGDDDSVQENSPKHNEWFKTTAAHLKLLYASGPRFPFFIKVLWCKLERKVYLASPRTKMIRFMFAWQET